MLNTTSLNTQHTLFKTPFGDKVLERFPKPTTGRAGKTGQTKQQPLQAWDAADEYLLHWLHDNQPEWQNANPYRTLVLNDQFGALTSTLPCRPLWSQTDSYLARCACKQNLNGVLNSPANHKSLEAFPREETDPQLLDSLQWPDQPLDLVIIRLPKHLALLEHQLHLLRALVTEHTTVVAAAMVKHWPSSAQNLFERTLGSSHTSLARKKARLLHCQPNPECWQTSSTSSTGAADTQPLSLSSGLPSPPYPIQYRLSQPNLVINSHANVFSASKLDIGSAFFLPHLPPCAEGEVVIDLGCGNGLLGLAVLQQQPKAQLHFVDESYMAIDSVRLNLQHNFANPEALSAHLQVNHSLLGFAANSADKVLCNPPFHQQTVVGDHLAWQMFTDAKRVLRTGGELHIVGNRHLQYHLKLKRLFGNCITVASNRKFVVLKAVK